MLTIENDRLTVRVKELGAELCGIYSKALGREYMWQPGHEIWSHSSLFMFPNPARIKGGRVSIGGRFYPQTMQGFAQYREFKVIEHEASKLVLGLDADEGTRERFPYEFSLRLEFILEDDSLRETIRVFNNGEGDMYFGLGLHPGFYLPVEPGEEVSDYRISFDRPQTLRRNVPQESTKLFTGMTDVFLDGESSFRLHDHIFDKGAIMCSGLEDGRVSLVSAKSGRGVEMGLKGFTDIAFWGNPVLPFLCCIEPWVSRSDLVDSDQIWENKPGLVKLAPGKEHINEVAYRVF